MERRAVSERLRTVAALLKERGPVRKGVDMSAAAVTARLKVQGALCDMCLRLARRDVSRSLRPA